MSNRLVERARAVAADRDSGAGEITRALLPVLEDASAQGADAVRAVVRTVCATQPGMAPLWNACAAAIADLESPGRLARFRQELIHRERAIVRVAGDAIAEAIAGAPGHPVVVTWSFSSTVATVLARLRRNTASAGQARLDDNAASAGQARGWSGPARQAETFTVICAEGRPRFEGRRMASTLAGAGVRVILATDAGATAGLEHARVVIVGADALLADRWINKVGTRALAATAAGTGCPVMVVATRDKALAPALAARLPEPTALGAGDPVEIWDRPPPGVKVVGPVFESIPADLATWFATDVGLLTPSDLPALVRRNEAEAGALLEAL